LKETIITLPVKYDNKNSKILNKLIECWNNLVTLFVKSFPVIIFIDGITSKKGASMSDRNKISQQTKKLIEHYEIELVSPPCIPGAAEWCARASLEADISEVLPYLNAELQGADYDHWVKVLIWKHGGHSYAFRPREIRVSPVEDRQEALNLVSKIIEKVNDIWSIREQITPDFKKITLPPLMSIYKLLPRTNCGECGYSTCMAFAADLREGKKQVEKCPVLHKHEYSENRKKLLDLFNKE